MKLTLNLSESTVKQVEFAADSLGVTRSECLRLFLLQGLLAHKNVLANIQASSAAVSLSQLAKDSHALDLEFFRDIAKEKLGGSSNTPLTSEKSANALKNEGDSNA
jgi:hypothetical protein